MHVCIQPTTLRVIHQGIINVILSNVEAAAELAAADGKMKAAAEVAAAVDAVPADAEAVAEVTAEVTAMIQEAELHGDVMTVAEAVWRHEMLLEKEQQWQRCACGDAAFPQGKQHRLRSRTKKKKKKR